MHSESQISVKKSKHNKQVVVRITEHLERRVEQAASDKGLTKASWVRQLIIEKLNNSSEPTP